jgi:hypothetical protein
MGMREKLIELIFETPCTIHEKIRLPAMFVDLAVRRIADHLIANGVTIPVRCKDCKHWSDGVAGCTDHVKCCKIGFYMVGENGYCVYGERKD